jgi:hypothetical protein
MPQLTFPLSAGELKLAVVIGHPSKALKALLAAGQSVPSPLWTTGIVDTGTNITCVTPAVLQKLSLASVAMGSSQTVSGPASVNLFEVSLSIPPAGNVAGPMLTYSDLAVMEMPSPIPGVDVLIGLDILLRCKLLLDGPAGLFTLEF